MRLTRYVLAILGTAFAITMGVAACRSAPSPTPIAPEVAAVMETEVAAKLAATLTAKAPPTPTATATTVPSPTTPSATATAEPTGTAAIGDQVAYALSFPDGSTNVVLSDEGLRTEQVLTHFVEKASICDISWSGDGEILGVTSSHSFILSRKYERNIFTMAKDGSDLHMVTGNHLDPAQAEAPFVTLRGQVLGCQGPALVSAQGVAAPVTTDETGMFELAGVPIKATWARAVCQANGQTLQGDVDLALSENPEPITIQLSAAGSGWIEVSLSPQGDMLVGIRYSWHLDEEQQQQYTTEGVILNLETGEEVLLPVPDEGDLTSVAWSHSGERIVGAVSDERGASLRLWDTAGNDQGLLLEISNEEQLAYSVADLAWSLDDSQIAFTRRDWDWLEERYRANIGVVSATGENLRIVVESDWGTAAEHPSWTNAGTTIYYQISTAATDSALRPATADIMRIRVDTESPTAMAWREDQRSSLPAIRPQREASTPGMPIAQLEATTSATSQPS